MSTNDSTQFGYGKVIYKQENDFPAVIQHNGCFWHRTKYSYEFTKTGMRNYLYETEDREEDLRLYVDAAGHIWDEKENGIM